MFVKSALLIAFYCLSVTASNSSQSFFNQIEVFSSPKALGTHILAQLEKKESRFLSKTCISQFLEYAGSLLKLEMWALRLFDASEKLPSGLFQGHGAALGAFDQCLAITANTTIGTIKGKYCIGRIVLSDLNMLSYKTQVSEMHQQKFFNVPENELVLPWGICLPDGCAADDYKFITLFIFKYSESFCQTAESQVLQYDLGDYIAIAILSVLGGIVICSTVLDIITRSKKKTFIIKICTSFSVRLNFKNITSKKIQKDEIKCLHGIRVITMFFIIGGMRFVMYPLSAVDNWLGLLTFIKDRYNIIVLEALISIDTFFVISGILISYNFLSRQEKGRQFNLFFYILKRIIRLTPTLAIVVLLQTTLLRHFGSGPIWPFMREQYITNSCREYWWTTLLYIQNYYNAGLTSICVMPSWFVAVHMQLFILSSLMLWPLAKAPKYTISLVGFLLVCAITSAFLASWVYDLNSILIFNIIPLKLENYLKNFYFPFHTRAASWIVGFLLGYILFESKKPAHYSKMKRFFRPWSVLLLWVLTMGLLVFCLLINQTFIKVDYNWVYHSLHNAFVRPVWAVAISWIIFACVHGYSGPVNTILSIPTFQVLSRMSYCVSLINFSLSIILTAQTRHGVHFSISDGFSRLWGDIVWSLLLGFLFTLVFESPFVLLASTISKNYHERKDNKSAISLEIGKTEEMKLK